MATFGNPSLSSHGQVEKPAPPVGVRADRDLGRLHQQKAQQRVTLLADVAQPSPIPAGLLRRHQPHIAGDLLAAAKAFWRSDDRFERQRRQRPHPRMGHQSPRHRSLLPLPAPEPASVPEFSESVDPVTPTGLADVGWPTAPAPTTAVGLSPPVATAPSYVMRRESSWVTLCASSMQKVASLQRSSSRMPLTISCFRKRSDQTSIQGRLRLWARLQLAWRTELTPTLTMPRVALRSGTGVVDLLATK